MKSTRLDFPKRETPSSKRAANLEAAKQKPTAKNLRRLRSGYDCFSSMNLRELRGLVGYQPELERIHDDHDRTVAYRWVARGLPAKSAAKKIKLAKTPRRRSWFQQLMDSDEKE